MQDTVPAVIPERWHHTQKSYTCAIFILDHLEDNSTSIGVGILYLY